MYEPSVRFPRIFIAGLGGGAGKTFISVGLIRALRQLGRAVAPFKKGPDYIDAGWLALAADRPCYNLDTYLVEKERVLQSFLCHTRKDDIAVIEGNRGLYDGIDPAGTTSSAEVAKLLCTPVILCVDCTKVTRTMAAVIAGCMHFDPEVGIKGIIINRVAGARHEKILRDSIERLCGIPVVGAIPKLDRQFFPERHMGLVPTPEHALSQNAADNAAQMANRYLDLKALMDIAAKAAEQPAFSRAADAFKNASPAACGPAAGSAPGERPRIGVLRDSAFQFYYPDNLEALTAAGAQLIFIDACKSKRLPALDGLYIGGGFPETQAETLCGNHAFLKAVKAAAEGGLPIYAECGGLMYLGKELVIGARTYPMTGVLPIVFGLSDRPQGLGYTLLEVETANPFFEVGTRIRGHEFRYAQILEWQGRDQDLVFGVRRGTGFLNRRDGISYKNVLAAFTHIHALGVPVWAEAMVRKALEHRCGKGNLED